MSAFDGTGLPDADRMRVIGLISSFTLSDARMANDAAHAAKKAMEAGQPPDPTMTLSYEGLLRELVDEQTFPRLYRMAWSAGPDTPQDERAEFLIGIDLILDGVQARIDRARDAGEAGRLVSSIAGSAWRPQRLHSGRYRELYIKRCDA